ncbi:hypothetical protein E4U21_007206 [Claviceps maximensis]|nr:hypothetical protein E4U21_007206 [Claviceps maximensis]
MPRVRDMLLTLLPLALPLGTRRASALQVAPGSPCSNLCLDDHGSGDGSSSGTGSYVSRTSSFAVRSPQVCLDEEFDSESGVVQSKKCLACLQESTYILGQESDQAWFLFHLRHVFATCILKSPHDAPTAPLTCATSETCGPLSASPGEGLPDVDVHVPVGSPGPSLAYCDADGGGALTTAPFHKACLECVRADGRRAYLANFLTALSTACLTKPRPSLPVPLNDTVFSTHAIHANPSAPPSSSSKLSHPAIALIVVAIAVSLLSAASFTLIILHPPRLRLIRRRQNHPPSLAGAAPATPHHDQEDQAEEYYAERFFEKPPSGSAAEGDLGPEALITASMSPVARSKPVPWGNLDHPVGEGAAAASHPPKERSGRRYARKAFVAARTWNLNVRTAAVPAAPRPVFTSPCRRDFSAPSSAHSSASSSPSHSYSPSWSPGTRWGKKEKQGEKEHGGMSGEVVSPQHAAHGPDHQGGTASALVTPVRTLKIQTSFPPPPTK